MQPVCTPNSFIKTIVNIDFLFIGFITFWYGNAIDYSGDFVADFFGPIGDLGRGEREPFEISALRRQPVQQWQTFRHCRCACLWNSDYHLGNHQSHPQIHRQNQTKEGNRALRKFPCRGPLEDCWWTYVHKFDSVFLLLSCLVICDLISCESRDTI